VKQLNENIGIIETKNVAKNPHISEVIEMLAHGFWLMLTVKNYLNEDYKYEVLDIKGNVIKLNKIQMQCEVIDCQNLEPNVYLLNIYRKNKILMSYRLVILERVNN